MRCQANILVTDDFRCCLADFGLSVISTESQAWTIATSSSFLRGAIHWLAPEYISPDTSPKAPHTSRDIYAFGCTIVEVRAFLLVSFCPNCHFNFEHQILTRKVPFHNCPNETAVLLGLLTGQRPTRPENVWCPDRLWGLAVHCWEQDSCNRPSAHETYIILQRIPVMVSDLSIQLQPLLTESRPPYATKVKLAEEKARIQEEPRRKYVPGDKKGLVSQSRTTKEKAWTQAEARTGSLSTVAPSGAPKIYGSYGVITHFYFNRNYNSDNSDPRCTGSRWRTSVSWWSSYCYCSSHHQLGFLLFLSWKQSQNECLQVFRITAYIPALWNFHTQSTITQQAKIQAKFFILKPNNLIVRLFQIIVSRNSCCLSQGNITKLEVDSIVNAANKSLLGWLYC